MSRSSENVSFTCSNCGVHVSKLNNGSYRNHCPACLHSLHVDDAPGDRASECGGLMRPESVDHHSAKGFMLVHRCASCGKVQRNKVATDCHQPDDMALITKMMARSLPGGLPGF